MEIPLQLLNLSISADYDGGPDVKRYLLTVSTPWSRLPLELRIYPGSRREPPRFTVASNLDGFGR